MLWQTRNDHGGFTKAAAADNQHPITRSSVEPYTSYYIAAAPHILYYYYYYVRTEEETCWFFSLYIYIYIGSPSRSLSPKDEVGPDGSSWLNRSRVHLRLFDYYYRYYYYYICSTLYTYIYIYIYTLFARPAINFRPRARVRVV